MTSLYLSPAQGGGVCGGGAVKGFVLSSSPGGALDRVLGANCLGMSMRFVGISTPSCLKEF